MPLRCDVLRNQSVPAWATVRRSQGSPRNSRPGLDVGIKVAIGCAFQTTVGLYAADTGL